MDKEFKYTEEHIRSISPAGQVRMRPRLYFEQCFREKTLDLLPFEVLCHAFDEYFDGSCKKIEISISQDCFTVSYDAGISLETKEEYDGLSKAEVIMTQIFACSNEKKHLAVGEEFCRVGMATINFAAERCELTTVCKGKSGNYVFENGVTTSRTIDLVNTQTDFTKIMVRPDKSLFENLAFTFEGITNKAKEINLRLPDLIINIHNHILAD